MNLSTPSTGTLLTVAILCISVGGSFVKEDEITMGVVLIGIGLAHARTIGENRNANDYQYSMVGQ